MTLPFTGIQLMGRDVHAAMEGTYIAEDGSRKRGLFALI